MVVNNYLRVFQQVRKNLHISRRRTKNLPFQFMQISQKVCDKNQILAKLSANGFLSSDHLEIMLNFI